MACCHHVRTMVSGLVIHFTLNFLKEAMGAALPRQSQILLLSKPTFKCLLLPMLRRPNTFCYETCFWFILCFFFFFELLTFVLFARALEHSAQLKPHGCRSVFFFFSTEKNPISLSKIYSFEEMVMCCLQWWQLCGKLPKYQQIWVDVLEESPQISSSFCHCSAPEQLKIFIISNSNQSPRLLHY